MPPPDAAVSAWRLVLGGRVQGVGFRPFVYRTARALGLSGWVRNAAGQVVIHVEGGAAELARFARALLEDAPPLARPHLRTAETAAAKGAREFRILASLEAEAPDAHLPPDLFCCDDCLAEFLDPAARRHRYPFTNCTQCGPRYTLIRALPYDRPNTAMAGFPLCPACGRDYGDPDDRRFHAQPLACPACGPGLTFRCAGEPERTGEAALQGAADSLRQGSVVAVKGVGGYHLMCDAANDAAVARLRTRKRRPHKPLAVMSPQEGADGLAAVRRYVALDESEARAILDTARPIVLARRREDARLSRLIAPGLAEVGVFLPYSPLHHLLLLDFGAALVATSGNISGEPVITTVEEAEGALASVADAFLHHDRPILRPADDSVVRVAARAVRPIRLGRGAAPLEIELPFAFAEPTLAVGGHLKATIALGWGRRAVVSPHIGDLDSPRSLQVFEQVIDDLQALYGVTAGRIACDAHPGYASARWARRSASPVIAVQHHAAHASALAGEHSEVSRWLIFTWDGLGLGTDGTLWGGEALTGQPGAWRRAGSLRPLRLLGGDRAGREPWRSAAALMWETERAWTPRVAGGALAVQAWRAGIGTAETSSAGRLFDAAAALILDLQSTSFEGQGPMMLESLAEAVDDAPRLPLAPDAAGVLRIDWSPLVPMLADETVSAPRRAGLFHESLARALAEQAAALAAAEPFEAVGLTGGVFQNRRLAERCEALLAEQGLPAYLPRLAPANDGGLALGQLMEVLALDVLADRRVAS